MLLKWVSRKKKSYSAALHQDHLHSERPPEQVEVLQPMVRPNDTGTALCIGEPPLYL